MDDKENRVGLPSPSPSPGPEPAAPKVAVGLTPETATKTMTTTTATATTTVTANSNEEKRSVDALTTHLESYLGHVDRYTSATTALQRHFSSGILALSRVKPGTGLEMGAMPVGGLIGLIGMCRNVERRVGRMRDGERERRGEKEKQVRGEEKDEDEGEGSVRLGEEPDEVSELDDDDIEQLCDWAKRVYGWHCLHDHCCPSFFRTEANIS